MKNLRSLIKTYLVESKRGGEFLEYIIVCGVVALLAVGAFTAFGGDVNQKIQAQGQEVLKIGP